MGISLIVMLCTCNIQILACRGVSIYCVHAVSNVQCCVQYYVPYTCCVPGALVPICKYYLNRENMLVTVQSKYDYRWSANYICDLHFISSSGLFHVRCVPWHEMKKTRIMIINNNVGQYVNINFHIIRIIDYTKRIKKMI